MTVDNEIAGAGIGAVILLQGWALKQIVSIKVELAMLKQRVDDGAARTARRHGAALACLIIGWCLVVMLCGCSSGLRAKGGSIRHSPGMSETLQPENAKDGAEQKSESQRNVELPIPAGSVVNFQRVSSGVTQFVSVTLAGPSNYRDVAIDNRQSKVGGSQVDTVGAIVAKLKAARCLTIMGALVCVGGLACAFVPYLSAILGGMTPGLAISGGGLVIAGLPYIIIGNERFLICGVLLAALLTIGAVFLYRHGGHSAVIKHLTKAAV